MKIHTTVTLKNLVLNDMDAEKNKMNTPEISVWLETIPEITGIQQTVSALPYKVKVPFSVDVLAYLVKLMVQAKLIDCGVRTELLGFVAKNFQTTGISSEGISIGSLETKYKQVVQTSAKTLRALLMRMINLLDDEFSV